MHKYELVSIVHPDLDETAFTEVVEKIKAWITEAKGTIDKVDIWGRKRLAYAIKKQREGQYVLFNISLDPAAALDLEKNLRFLEPVIRFMLIVVD